MSLIFIDGFDHTDKSRDKWELVGYDTIPPKVLGRFGGEAIQRPTGIDHVYMGKTFVAQADLFMGCAIRFPAFNAADDAMFKFGKAHEYDLSKGAPELSMVQDVDATHAIATVKSDGSIRLDVNALTVTSSAGVLVVNTWQYIEFRFFPAASGGVFECKVDGSVVATVSGDTSQPSGEFLEAMYLMSSLFTSVAILYDDLYLSNALGTVNNTYLGDMRVDIMLPDTTGLDGSAITIDQTVWASTTTREDKWQDLDNVPSLYYTNPDIHVPMAGFASAGSTPRFETYQAQSYADLGFTPGTIHGIQMSALVRYEIASIPAAKWEILPAVTSHVGNPPPLDGSNFPLGHMPTFQPPVLGIPKVEFGYKTGIMEINPVDSLAWTDAALTNLYTGIVGNQ